MHAYAQKTTAIHANITICFRLLFFVWFRLACTFLVRACGLRGDRWCGRRPAQKGLICCKQHVLVRDKLARLMALTAESQCVRREFQLLLLCCVLFATTWRLIIATRQSYIRWYARHRDGARSTVKWSTQCGQRDGNALSLAVNRTRLLSVLINSRKLFRIENAACVHSIEYGCVLSNNIVCAFVLCVCGHHRIYPIHEKSLPFTLHSNVCLRSHYYHNDAGVHRRRQHTHTVVQKPSSKCRHIRACAA